ncbi:MAG: PAS domain S-box protein, partial [Syntrophales bacterium LBB04]|nr:PAS domain S-box protein [Syntrophales bacterium LBB04]
GEPRAFISVIRDITERKMAEEALRTSEVIYREIFNAVNDTIWVHDVKTLEFLDVNNKVIEMFGYTVKEALELDLDDISSGIPPFTKETGAELLKKAMAGEPQIFEWHCKHKDGHFFWTEVNLKRGTVAGKECILAIERDITERKTTEGALQASEKQYRSVIENIQDVFYRSDVKGRLLMGSPSGAIMFGYETINEMIGTNLSSFWMDPSERERLLVQLRATGSVKDFEAVLKRKDGSTFNASFTTHFYTDDHGNFLGTEGIIRDITERKRAEAEKYALQAQLLQAQKMELVGRLAGGVAHDFNNMLSAILGHTELAMIKQPRWDPIQDDLKVIKDSAIRSADLTRQLLAFARKQTITPKVLDLNDTVAGTYKMLQRLIGEDTDLIWMPGANLWPIKIDPSQVDQLLANLCVNARDAISGVGKITIKTENTAFDEAYCTVHKEFICGEYVVLSISDDGNGMSQEVLDHLFEPFFTTKEIGKGTGLGLATVYGIVTQNEGFIKVYSEPGKGTTFQIHLPRFAGEVLNITTETQAETARGQGEMVLLVEDEPVILKVGQSMLERLGYTVVTASTPGEALRQAKKYAAEIQLLITDVIMPEMNGRDLAKLINEINPGLKYLFISGYTANVIAHCGVLDEGVSFLEKPFSIKDFGDKIRQVLEQK